MKNYYTGARRTPESPFFMFQCFLNYDEAIDNAKNILELCCIDHVDIVDMDTHNVFITFHRLYGVSDKTNSPAKKQECTVLS